MTTDQPIYILSTPDELLADQNVKAVSIKFKTNSTSMILAKDVYLQVLDDIKAWKYILFGHPMMDMSIKTKLRIRSGTLIDNTPRLYGIEYYGFKQYLACFMTKSKFLMTMSEDDSVIKTKLRDAMNETIPLGGSSLLSSIVMETDYECARKDAMLSSNPMSPTDDVNGYFEWDLTTVQRRRHAFEPTSQVYVEEDEEELFYIWSRRRL